ncbi:MAG: hypothetical protein JXA60_12090 [Candidatus Coatesbacteria bacterium]|nr:hypothetical protein [Candidatus Coatesbacteria bacterium]
MNLQIPDFDKIYSACSVNIVNATDPEAHKVFLEYYNTMWDELIKSEIPNEIDTKFRLLIEEYSLEKHYSNLFFLAFTFIKDFTSFRGWQGYTLLFPERNRELLYALKFYFDNNLKDIKVVIKHKIKNQSTTINNLLLIQVIKDALLSELKEKNLYDAYGRSKEPKHEITDWIKYINTIIAEKKVSGLQKGRKKRHDTPRAEIDVLQVYLQEFTNLKAEPGKPISRKQASFIYKLLDQFGFFPEDYSWKEDSIRHMLIERRSSNKKFLEWYDE